MTTGVRTVAMDRTYDRLSGDDVRICLEEECTEGDALKAVRPYGDTMKVGSHTRRPYGGTRTAVRLMQLYRQRVNTKRSQNLQTNRMEIEVQGNNRTLW